MINRVICIGFSKTYPQKNVPTCTKKSKISHNQEISNRGRGIEYLCTYDVIITFKVNLGTIFADAYAETKIFLPCNSFHWIHQNWFSLQSNSLFSVKIHLTVFIFLSRSVIGPWEELIQKHNLTTLKGFDDVFIPQRHTDWCFNKTKVCM